MKGRRRMLRMDNKSESILGLTVANLDDVDGGGIGRKGGKEDG